jgi:hypothetical protein
MFIELQSSGFSDLLLLSVSTLIVLGHNLWLVPRNDAGEIAIATVTSDKFPESESAVKPERIASFRYFADGDATEIEDYRVEGNSLVAYPPTTEHVSLVALDLHPHPIVLEADKFAGYIRSEEAESFVAPQFVAAETTESQRESYSKFAKVMIDDNAIGKAVGQKLEIVFESNPLEIRSNAKLKVKALFEGEPMANLRLSAGAEELNEGRYCSHVRTDENGSAELEINCSGLWFVRTHYIRAHSDNATFDWESFWASVTFRI